MSRDQSKLTVAARMGIDLPSSTPEGARDEIGREIRRRAAYGRVNADSIEKYLKALRECGIIVKAALAANLSYSSILNLRKRDPIFAEEEEAARQQFVAEKIDAPLYKWGFEGVNRVIIDRFGTRHEGEKVIQPQIALAVARKFDPAYRDKQEIDVNHGGGVMVVTAKLGEDDLEAYARRIEAQKRDVLDADAKSLPDNPG